MTSYKELLAERKRLTAEINAARAREVRAVIDGIRRTMAEYGLTVKDLDHLRDRRFSSGPRYRDPVTGNTWSGHGRAPAWIIGKDRTLFVIGN
ncbi:DNA-binding protein H-NS [Paraburkholderia sp. GAS448]|uniref:H-NS histone family protein n=1 Tax=Paraburkholderia sp. GAS448 TaxID=3035136 RepID=UPI003D1DC5D5